MKHFVIAAALAFLFSVNAVAVDRLVVPSPDFEQYTGEEVPTDDMVHFTANLTSLCGRVLEGVVGITRIYGDSYEVTYVYWSNERNDYKASNNMKLAKLTNGRWLLSCDRLAPDFTFVVEVPSE